MEFPSRTKRFKKLSSPQIPRLRLRKERSNSKLCFGNRTGEISILQMPRRFGEQEKRTQVTPKEITAIQDDPQPPLYLYKMNI